MPQKRRITLNFDAPDGLENFDFSKAVKGQTQKTIKQPASIDQVTNKDHMYLPRIPKDTDTSFETLESCWGEDGSWHAFAEMPKNREQGFTTRKLGLWPKNIEGGGNAMELVASLGVGAINIKGCKGAGDTAIGQDSCSISCLPDGAKVFCVMDGHGPDGQWPADRAVRTLPFFLQCDHESSLRSTGASDMALIEAFRKAEKDLEDWAVKEKVQLLVSGTTAVCVLHQEADEQLWVATVGDSRALLIVPGIGLVQQTRDHKPSDPEERKRLEESGCEVEIIRHDATWTEERVYVKGQGYPGIAMSRSLGDTCVEDKGCYSKPEVLQWSLAHYPSSYVLLASDGIWEFMSNEEVATFVLDGLEKRRVSVQQIVQELLDMSRAKWYEEDPDYTDDITVMLVPCAGGSDVGSYPVDASKLVDACKPGGTDGGSYLADVTKLVDVCKPGGTGGGSYLAEVSKLVDVCKEDEEVPRMRSRLWCCLGSA